MIMKLPLLKPDELMLKNLGNEKQTPFITKLDMELAAIEKGGYDHFMLKEIYEQPKPFMIACADVWMLQDRNDYHERH